jgi:hypothetical protein
MKNLTTSIYTMMAGTTLDTAIGGRLYKLRAPQGTALPYVIFFVVSDVYQPTFTEDMEQVIIQFSIFSESSSTAEIEDIYDKLKLVYDNKAFTPTGNKVVVMTRQNAILTSGEADLEAGTGEYYQYDIDYEVIMSKD